MEGEGKGALPQPVHQLLLQGLDQGHGLLNHLLLLEQGAPWQQPPQSLHLPPQGELSVFLHHSACTHVTHWRWGSWSAHFKTLELKSSGIFQVESVVYLISSSQQLIISSSFRN